MKYLIALLLVATTLQPAALPACAMDVDHDASPHASAHHGAMPHEAGQHGTIQRGAAQDGHEPGCCDHDAETPMQDCDTAAHCISFSPGFAAIPPAVTGPVPAAAHHYRLTQDQRFNALPGPPLLRPPIA